MSDENVPFLTQEAYDRLAAEHEHLSTVGREEIAKRIEAAREEGDLKETAAITRRRTSRASRKRASDSSRPF